MCQVIKQYQGHNDDYTATHQDEESYTCHVISTIVALNATSRMIGLGNVTEDSNASLDNCRGLLRKIVDNLVVHASLPPSSLTSFISAKRL